MTTRKAVLLVCLATALLPPGAFAASTWTFRSMESALTEISGQSGLSDSERASLKNASHLVRAMNDRYLRTFGDSADTSESVGKKLPPEFIKSMEADTQALLESAKEPKTRAATIEEVNEDLTLKRNFAESALGIGGGFPAVIKVIVETMRQGKKVDGLWVRCNPRRYGVNEEPMYVFNSASSPTEATLPPGLFVMWVESSDHKVLASQPIDLGADGSSSATIRFALP